MAVQVILRKIGNSTGFSIPASFLNETGLKEGDTMTMDSQSDGTVTLKRKAPKYTLQDLLAQCDRKAAPPADMAAWDASPAFGQEML